MMQATYCRRTAGQVLKSEKIAEIFSPWNSSRECWLFVSAHDDEIASNLSVMSNEGKLVITLATPIRGIGAQNYIGPDNRKAGRVAGDLMGRFLGRDGGEVVVIAGLLSMIGHEEREMGFRAVLRERYGAKLRG